MPRSICKLLLSSSAMGAPAAAVVAPVWLGTSHGAIGQATRWIAPVLGWDQPPDEALDRPQLTTLIRIAQRDCDAPSAGAGRAANAVHVSLRDVRQLIVDYVRHLIDVEAAGGNVGRHQRSHPRHAQVRERTLALGLTFVAVDGGNANARRIEVTGDPVGSALGLREH
jgi:hypothetical protein